MTRPKPKNAPALAQFAVPSKHAVLRAKERMTLADHKGHVPYTNATTAGLYLGRELDYRGKHANK